MSRSIGRVESDERSRRPRPRIVKSTAALGFVAIVAVLSAQLAHSYVAIAKWNKRGIYWNSAFQHGQSLAGFPTSSRQQIANAAYQWDDVKTGADFDVDETTGSNNDVWVEPVSFYAVGRPPDVPGANLVLYSFSGSYVLQSNIILNSDWSWTSNCIVQWDQYRAHVQLVSTHEFGHSMSLDHDPNHPESVMWSTGSCKLTTTSDDDNGMKYLYP